MTLEHSHSSGKIPVEIEQLKIQQTEEAISSAQSRRSLGKSGDLVKACRF